ncbi:unnamed protein product [Cuscuta campestris]|uniref:Uncharacterized protein n=1 Tax=Cuscuta campestris TaxID=132261 RepID=A0A484K8P1_9ASTE|nr:unnamed protein product [Cuscuta campestris]
MPGDDLNECVNDGSRDYYFTSINPDSNDDYDPQGWLQLTVGLRGTASTSRHGSGGTRVGLVELDLLPPGPSGASTTTAEVRTPFPPSPPPPSAVGCISATPPYSFLQHPARAFRPAIPSQGVASAGSPSSYPVLYSPPLPLAGSRFAPRPPVENSSVDTRGGAYNFRVIDPPRRPHAGIWFSLQASKIQAKEPYLPQIPKSFLRIKDGSMTVRLVLKYLAQKLHLNNESEVFYLEASSRATGIQWLRKSLPPYGASFMKLMIPTPR